MNTQGWTNDITQEFARMISAGQEPGTQNLREEIHELARNGDRPGILAKLKEEQAALLENVRIGGDHGALLVGMVSRIDLDQVANHLGRGVFVLQAIDRGERQRSGWADRISEWQEPSARRGR